MGKDAVQIARRLGDIARAWALNDIGQMGEIKHGGDHQENGGDDPRYGPRTVLAADWR